MKKRAVPPQGRHQKALATRRRVLRSATNLFVERGYAGTTMDLIADAASVAVQTLYFTFHTKSALLEECVGAAVIGLEHWDPRLAALAAAEESTELTGAHVWFPSFERASSASSALRRFVSEATRILGRVAALSLVQHEAAASDALVRATFELAERRRIHTFEVVAASLAKRRRLRPKLSVRRARDIMLTLLSAETYNQLVLRLGWSVRAYETWCAEVLETQLYA